ncbi:MAG: hypothetical protein Q9172_006880 [Xanthocarpia lactea]
MKGKKRTSSDAEDSANLSSDEGLMEGSAAYEHKRRRRQEALQGDGSESESLSFPSTAAKKATTASRKTISTPTATTTTNPKLRLLAPAAASPSNSNSKASSLPKHILILKVQFRKQQSTPSTTPPRPTSSPITKILREGAPPLPAGGQHDDLETAAEKLVQVAKGIFFPSSSSSSVSSSSSSSSHSFSNLDNGAANGNESASEKKASKPNNNDSVEVGETRERYGMEKEKEKDLEGMHSLLSAAEMLETCHHHPHRGLDSSPAAVVSGAGNGADDGSTGTDMSVPAPHTA